MSNLARLTYIGFAWLFAASIAVQVLLAGLALFADPAHWSRHADFARYFAFLPLLMLLAAWTGRLPKELAWRSLGLFGIVIALFLTAILSSRIGALSALHPVIALFLFWSCIAAIRRSGIIRQDPAGIE